MERYLLAGSTLCYLLASGYSLVLSGAGKFRSSRFILSAMVAGFALQTTFLYLRGQAIGRCPITNPFEILVFLSWSVAIAYLVVGAAYRISLLGAFTAPLVLGLQLAALLLAPDKPPATRMPADAWLELHAATSLMAYGVLALGCVAGVMYLVQEKQLKMRVPGSIFHVLPPLTTLTEAMRRLLWFGTGLLTAGILAGFPVGLPVGHGKAVASLLVWIVYAGVLVLWRKHHLGPRGAAMACTAAFVLALVTLPAMYALNGYFAH